MNELKDRALLRGLQEVHTDLIEFAENLRESELYGTFTEDAFFREHMNQLDDMTMELFRLISLMEKK